MDDLRHLTQFLCSKIPAWPAARRRRRRGEGTLVLTRRDIAAMMQPADYRMAVERAFAAAHAGRGTSPPPMHLGGDGGGFHVKGAAFAAGTLSPRGRAYAAFKINGNFPGNPERRGLPTIQGALVLCDGDDGRVLALMDSIEITLQRTAAATALAAVHLARPGSAVITICGCGAQAWPQLRALADVLPLVRGFAWDRDAGRARAFADRAARSGVAVEVATDLTAATLQSDVIVTCTTASTPFLGPSQAPPGAFVAAVGADSPAKNEIAPELMARAVVVVDVLDQCREMGDLRHALAAGVLTTADVHAELGQLAAGARPGRRDGDSITLFDSTGTAVQDVASAAALYERASALGVGLAVNLGGD